MIVPVGERYEQTLYLFRKIDGKLEKVALLPTLFVPMTGKAEDSRVAKPDPAKPQINNGGFEEVSVPPVESSKPEDDKSKADVEKSEPTPQGWHYQRQLKLVEEDEAPQGGHYVTFSNTEPGRGAHALQGMAVDGRKVSALDVSLWVKGANLRAASPEQEPVLAVTFYDENRSQAGYTWVGPWRDSFAWRKVSDRLRVPPKAREAIVRIGLSGATGELSFDDIQIRAHK